MKTPDQPLTREQVLRIVRRISITRDRELDCSGCAQHISEFAESRQAGRPTDGVLADVEQHLAICPHCREEYQALEKILTSTA